MIQHQHQQQRTKFIFPFLAISFIFNGGFCFHSNAHFAFIGFHITQYKKKYQKNIKTSQKSKRKTKFNKKPIGRLKPQKKEIKTYQNQWAFFLWTHAARVEGKTEWARARMKRRYAHIHSHFMPYERVVFSQRYVQFIIAA